MHFCCSMSREVQNAVGSFMRLMTHIYLLAAHAGPKWHSLEEVWILLLCAQCAVQMRSILKAIPPRAASREIEVEVHNGRKEPEATPRKEECILYKISVSGRPSMYVLSPAISSAGACRLARHLMYSVVSETEIMTPPESVTHSSHREFSGF